MRTLRFHRLVYSGEAVDAAAKRLAKFGTFELREQDDHFVVEVTAADPARERAIAGTLANFALAQTVEQGGV